MTTNLNRASNQWASRPADERFESLTALQSAAHAVRNRMVQLPAMLDKLHIEPVGSDGLELVSDRGSRATMTNHAFGQFCARVGFSANEIAKVSNKLAADILNYRLDKTKDAQDTKLNMVADIDPVDNSVMIRAATTERFALIPNAAIVDNFLMKLGKANWKVPPARPAMSGQSGTRQATRDDVLANNSGGGGLAIREGDLIAPAGLYMGDRDMFAFMVNTDNQIDDGTGRKWNRGIFGSNSEVGAGSVDITEFWFANVCGNHIVWDAKNIVNIKYRHIGNAGERVMAALGQAVDRLTSYVEVKDRAAALQVLRTTVVGAGKDEVVDTIYEKRISPILTRKMLSAGYDAAEVYGDIDGAKPNTILGIVHGLTRHSQTLTYASDRTDVDTAAGKILTKASKDLRLVGV